MLCRIGHRAASIVDAHASVMLPGPGPPGLRSVQQQRKRRQSGDFSEQSFSIPPLPGPTVKPGPSAAVTFDPLRSNGGNEGVWA